jgi:transaldolase
MRLQDLEIELFLDDPGFIKDYANDSRISGFTSNPSLLKRAGIQNYEHWARFMLKEIGSKPLALEVMSDDFIEMYRQAKIIQSWGKNVNVKIPITNTKGESSVPLIIVLINDGITVNVTAITTLKQTIPILELMKHAKSGFVSIFCGRVSDCGENGVDLMTKIVYLKNDICPHIKLIWASTREVYNIIQANQCGCDIITIGADILKKLPLLGIDLEEISLRTVKMFYSDAQTAGYTI